MNSADVPATFRTALASIASAHTRADVRLSEVPAPPRIAAYAAAINATVLPEELDTTGRLVLLHEPGGNDAWNGDLRIIALVKARVETEIGSDDLWADAAWSFLYGRDTKYARRGHAAAGTLRRAQPHRAREPEQ